MFSWSIVDAFRYFAEDNRSHPLKEFTTPFMTRNRSKELESLRWVTRHEPHLDRCASAWLIKRFIDQDARFEFISREDPIPVGAIPFVLPKAEINPVEGVKTTFDTLMEKYQVKDPIVSLIQDIINDFEVDAEEDPARVRLLETVGVFKIVRGLARISKTDDEIISKAFVVFDSLYAQLLSEAKEKADRLK
jgi:hypothetical protein